MTKFQKEKAVIKEILKLVNNELIVSVVKSKLGSNVIFDNIWSWWSFKHSDSPIGPQNFHRDYNSINFLKLHGQGWIWIKDDKDSEVYFINAEKVSVNKLHNIDILVFNKNFQLIKTIFIIEADISNKKWLMDEAIIVQENGDRDVIKNYSFFSNFDYIKINNLYSDLSALNIFELMKLQKDYKEVNYSTTEIDIHIKRMISYPFFLAIMTIFSSIIMLNIKHQKPKVFYAVGGVLISVLIYYINFFFGALGKNEQIPIILSIWLPISVLSIISLIGITRLNEK